MKYLKVLKFAVTQDLSPFHQVLFLNSLSRKSLSRLRNTRSYLEINLFEYRRFSRVNMEFFQIMNLEPGNLYWIPSHKTGFKLCKNVGV